MIPYLSSRLAKNDKIISMFVIVPGLFGKFKGLAIFTEMGREGGGGQTLLESSRTGCFLGHFSKVQQLNNNCSKICGYFD